MLAKGSNETLQGLATFEIKDPTPSAVAQKDLALGWCSQADKVSSAVIQNALRRHAAYWFRRAEPGLTPGPGLAELTSHMKDITKKIPALADPWAHVLFQSTPVISNGTVTLNQYMSMRTKGAVSAPLEVNAEVRSNGTAGIAIAIGDTRLSINPMEKPGDVEILDTHSFGPRSGVQKSTKSFALEPKRWHAVRWQITATGTRLWVDGNLVLEDTKARDLSVTKTVHIQSTVEPLYIKSFDARRLP